MFRQSLFTIVVLLAGCGSDAQRDESFGALETVQSTGGLSIEVRSSPSPPVRGVDAFELTVTKDGKPVEGLAVAVEPWMTAHGHGASVQPDVTAEGGGKYLVKNVSLFMPGSWELRTTLGNDHATITVDIP